MALSADRKKSLRSIGHRLDPVVTVAGKGLSDGVQEELARALGDHELIKVKLAIGDRELRKQIDNDICRDHGAELVQAIGKVVLIYRHNPDADPRLSNIARNPVA